jgi:hypothetical protein
VGDQDGSAGSKFVATSVAISTDIWIIDIGEEYNFGPVQHPTTFETLTAARRAPTFAAGFNKTLLTAIMARLQQAIDIQKAFQVGAWWDQYEAMFVAAAQTVWATAEWDVLDDDGIHSLTARNSTQTSEMSSSPSSRTGRPPPRTPHCNQRTEPS